jgi:hypothetical protein
LSPSARIDNPADDKQLTKLINRYGRVDLILVDLFRSRDYAESATV